MTSTPTTSTELPGLVVTPDVREVPANAPVIRIRSFGLIGGTRVRVQTA